MNSFQVQQIQVNQQTVEQLVRVPHAMDASATQVVKLPNDDLLIKTGLGIEAKPQRPIELCVVCGDRASGNHPQCTQVLILHQTSLNLLKDLMPITFSSPRAQPEVVHFLISNESPYFSSCKSKISASNSL